MSHPSNLHLLTSSHKPSIQWALNGIDGHGHFTNGIYAAPADVILPTTLAGFQCVLDLYSKKNDAVLLGINSDASVGTIYAEKKQKFLSDLNDEADRQDDPEIFLNSQEEFVEQRLRELDLECIRTESFEERADKLAKPLALQFSDKPVIIFPYDEATPTEIYDYLAQEQAIGMGTLFKWGFGTDPKAARIEGAYNFNNVVGFPWPGDQRPPIAYDITKVEDQSDFVTVIKLQETEAHRKAYMSEDKKLLFPLHPSLQRFAAPVAIAQPTAGPAHGL